LGTDGVVAEQIVVIAMSRGGRTACAEGWALVERGMGIGVERTREGGSGRCHRQSGGRGVLAGMAGHGVEEV
jgi:hypothetical protein